MARRLISTSHSEIRAMSAAELKESIRDSEGRVVLCQNYVGANPLADGTTNAELAQAFGADMIFFNGYSMTPGASQPGLQVEQWENGGFVQKSCRLKDMKALIHVPLGIYLECGTHDVYATSTSGTNLVRTDRVASDENLRRVLEEQADFIILAGNPGTGTDNRVIVDAARRAKEILGDQVLIFAGKWEDGVHQKVLGDPLWPMETHKKFIADLIDAGADVICMPMPGCRPGIVMEDIRELTTFAHSYGNKGALVMSFLDCSVEGADEDTVRQCTLWSKMTGADIHAIGDAGLCGMSVPEDIYAMSIALKGRRLTFRRMGGGGR